VPRNGSGTYSLPEAAFISGTVIDPAAVNSDFSDIASTLTTSVASDGQTPMTGNLNMNSNAITGATNVTASGAVSAATLTSSGATTVGTTLSVTGVATLSSTLNLAGQFNINTNKFQVASASGNTTVAGTLGVTGAATFSSTAGITGNLAVNTNKFNVTAASGNTTVAGTLGVTGAATFSSTGAFTGAVTAANGTSGSQVVNFSQFAQSLGTSGYITLPGGLRLQWGNDASVVGNKTTSYPVAFSGAPYGVWAIVKDTPLAGTQVTVGVAASPTSTQAVFVTTNAGTGVLAAANYFWWAIGPA